jgi:heme oxygenase
MMIDPAHVESQPRSSRPGAHARAPGVARADTILDRLKLETAAEHEAVEGATGVMAPGLTLAGYRAYLERTFGFYLIVEQQLRAHGVWEALRLPATARQKLPLLAEDLVLLGNLEPASIRACDAPPDFASIGEAVGGAYVIEGSTLGGRVILRHIQRRFGPNVAHAFLDGYGANTGKKWQSFRAALERFASSREIEDRMVAGAQKTFHSFARWLAR